MTITYDQAKTLLDDRSPMGREWHPVMQFSARHAAVVNEDGECIMPIRYAGECTSFNDGDIRLAAAAPDLARTVIDQAEKIDALSSALRFMYETYNTDIARLAAELPDNEMVYDLETGHPDGEATMNCAVGILHQAREADQ
ncbi:hypothetical protein [Corynebacterium sp.]|uniref:hypothetical protein n=1 Tax=Corynebacterium sp. TaxID=1720 RepID=UPI0028A8D6A4|nr:hypothetical protein [Corynebacterium sp.]